MKDIIKDRIEKIENNIVPQGYKKTEIGIIPEDWKVEKLGEVSVNGSNYGINAPAVTYNKNLPKYLRITDIDEFGNYSTINKKSVNDNMYKNFILQDGDIVFARTGNTTGKTYLYNKKDGELVYAGYLIKFSLNKKLVNKHFIFNLTKINKYKYWVKVMSARSGQPGINGKEYESLNLPIPPLKEQEKIASILSTWDQYIENIDSIIESKKKQKKGLMQNLLTGEVRLPGFNGEWKEVKLGDICEITTGNKDNKDNKKDGKYPFYVRSNNILRINEYSYDGEAILIPGDGKIGEIFHYINGKFNFHQRVYKISDFNINVLGKYIYYYLVQFFKREAKKYSAKATVDSLRRETFLNMKINLPPLDEQVAIASVLSSADREIELLEDLRNKRMEEKKGLMQLLLTGIVRVGG